MRQIDYNFAKKMLIFSALIFLSISLISAADEYKPYLHNPSVGEVPELNVYGSYETALFPGAGTYNYNLEVPIGTNGLAPVINLNYNSQFVNQRPGMLGAGWSLTENYIKRDINYTPEDVSDDYFVLMLNGNSYKVMYNEGEFYTEIKSYLLIENLSVSNRQYWSITDKNGINYRLGYNENSVLDSNAGKSYDLEWKLDQVTDTHNNKIYYSYNKNPYSEDKGTVYLSNITYNNDKLRLITFEYESLVRSDRRVIYDQGNELEESRRLQNVNMYFDGNLIRKYSLEYLDLNSEKSLSSIANITQYGLDGVSVFSTVGFEYYGEQKGFDNSTGNWEMSEAFSSKSSSKDYGIRLIDVNNDGFVDVVKSREEGSSKYTKLNDKEGNWDTSSNFLMPIYLVRNIDASNKDFDNGIRFGDLNKDGLVDFIQCLDSSGSVYLNNETGWEDDSSWIIPSEIDCLEGSYNEKDAGVRLADVNGDGRIDFMKAKSGEARKIYLNNGTGWEDDSSWIIPADFVTSDNKDNELRLMDFNGDGLVDLIQGGKPGNAWINNGTGWETYDQYAPDTDFTDYNDRPDLGVRFMDINGDNLVDMLQNFYSNVTIEHLNTTCLNETNMTEENCTTYTYNVTSGSTAKINNGTGWISGADWISPEWFTYEGHNIGRRIADVNGDGYADIIKAYDDGGLQKITYIRNATSSFLMKKITNNYGGETILEYTQSSLKENNGNLGFNLWIVENVTLDNSLSGVFSVISNYQYNYFGGLFNYLDSEFRGFNIVNETNPDNSIISHHFNQDEILKGREYKTNIYDENFNLYNSIENFYSYSSENEIHLDFITSSNYDDDLIPYVTNISYGYDDFGNINSINDFGNVLFSGDEKIEQHNFMYNLSENILNKISNYTLLDSGSNVVKRSWYYYDNLTTGVNIGDLTKIENYNDLGENPTLEFVYDSYGNQIQSIDAKGYSTYYSYDSTINTFILSTTNELGHQTLFEYNYTTSNLLTQSQDGLNKSYEYDLFGRIIKEAIYPDNLNSPTKIYSYNLDGSAPEYIKVESKNNETDYSEMIYFYDGFSNLIQIKTLYNENLQIIKNYFYDSKFRISQEENPYFAFYSESLEDSSSAPMIYYEYDPMNRVVNLTKQDGNNLEIFFNKSEITSYDENENKIKYYLDSRKNIVNISEYNGGEIYNTSYFYDASNQLRRIVDNEGNIFLFSYDSLGRKIEIADPNMENWTYGYDLNNNLVNQTDGRGYTTYLDYDELNRLTIKYSNGTSNITFDYDDQINGTLSSIDVNDRYFEPIQYRYIYGDRLRIIEEGLSVHIDENNPGDREWINVSVDYDSQDRILNMYLPYENLTYSYNSLGKIEEIGEFITQIDYNSFGSVANRTYSNNLVTQIDYDEIGRVSTMVTGEIQDLIYTYDGVGNVESINDTINSKFYEMEYDSLNRLTQTIIFNFILKEHEKFTYVYDAISNLLSKTTDTEETNFSYSDLAHAPTGISVANRSTARFEFNLIYPTSDIEVNQNEFFNYSTQICCRDNDCWEAEVYLDPQDEGFTENSETICEGNVCNKIIYSGTRFVFEDEEWKKIEDARSLKDVWKVKIDLDEEFPVEILDYNHTSITLDLSIKDKFRTKEVSLKVYSKIDKKEKPKNVEGKVIDKDKKISFDESKNKVLVIDLSDTNSNLLEQEIKWGDASTIITVYDSNSENLGDSHVRNQSSYEDQNYGTESIIEILNASVADEHRQGLIKFNLSQIPHQASIQDAQLNFWVDKNNLDAGEGFNVSSYSLLQNYSWDEDTINWLTKPVVGDYNYIETDKEYFIGGTYKQYQEFIEWDVTSVIKQKNDEESFYLVASESEGVEGSDYVGFSSKENPAVSERPFLNVTYFLKGIISTQEGETPFYTNVSNPYYVDLEKDECQDINWHVNATGEKKSYTFFTFTNKSSDGTLYTESDFIDITII